MSNRVKQPQVTCSARSSSGRYCTRLLGHTDVHAAGESRWTEDTRPILLDLFCGAGGAGMGYHRWCYRVIGVDLDPGMLKSYPFAHLQDDAFAVLRRLMSIGSIYLTKPTGARRAHPDGSVSIAVSVERIALADIVAIHASPPCQAFSDLQKRTGLAYPELIKPTRDLLEQIGKPYIIENVDNAPLRDPVMLCGTMFPREALRVLRHRLFETSFHVPQPPHPKHPLVFTHDKRKPHYGKLDQNAAFVQVTGGGNCKADVARRAMGIEWMSKAQLNEAIPPAYTSYIGRFIP